MGMLELGCPVGEDTITVLTWWVWDSWVLRCIYRVWALQSSLRLVYFNVETHLDKMSEERYPNVWAVSLEEIIIVIGKCFQSHKGECI